MPQLEGGKPIVVETADQHQDGVVRVPINQREGLTLELPQLLRVLYRDFSLKARKRNYHRLLKPQHPFLQIPWTQRARAAVHVIPDPHAMTVR